MTQSLNVEYLELIARANEIEAPLPPVPVGNPQAPCALSFVRDAAVQVAINSDTLRMYLQGCMREWKELAKSLRTAAKAYEDVDAEAASNIDAINTDGSTSGSGAQGSSGGTDGQAPFSSDDYTPSSPPPPPGFEYPYYEVRQAARDIESPDQGTAFRNCASGWDKFQRTFQQLTYRFRPFVSWEGDARAAVEQNFDSQRTWIYTMAGNCTTLSKQAQMVADAHKKVRPSMSSGGQYYGLEGEHPSSYEVSQCDYWYKYYVQHNSYYLYMALDWYKNLQKRSETAVSTYISTAGIPLPPLNPTSAPSAYVIKPPAPKPDDGGGGGGKVDPNPNDPSANIPTTPQTPMMPMTPMTPSTATPSTPDAQAMVDNAMKKAGLGKGGPGGVKPASLGGAGGAGMPKMPLQPSTGAGGDAAPRPASAAPGAATAGLGKLPGAGGAGGGMGGMPMGGQGGKGDSKEGKRVQGAEDDALYTEERAWTEGVIGNRPRKGPPEK